MDGVRGESEVVIHHTLGLALGPRSVRPFRPPRPLRPELRINSSWQRDHRNNWINVTIRGMLAE